MTRDHWIGSIRMSKMSSNQEKNGNGRKFFVLVWAISTIPLIRFIADWTKGFDFLIYQYLADDAFYYFEISKHIPEFNLGIPNSGFHPLYAIIISPLHKYLGYQLAISLNLLFLIIANCSSVLLVYSLLSIYWDRAVAMLSAFLLAISPLMYGISLTGVETIMATAVLFLFFLQFARIQANDILKTSLDKYIVLGLIAGTSFLARMDSPLIIAPALMFFIFKLLKGKEYEKSVSLVLATLLLPLSWIVYIYNQTGHLFPTSGAALRVLRGIEPQILADLNSIRNSIAYILLNLVDFFIVLPYLFEVAALIVFFTVGIIGFLAFLRTTKFDKKTSTLTFVVLVTLGVIIWISYYTFYQGGFRGWYLSQLGLWIFIVYLPMVLAIPFTPKEYERAYHPGKFPKHIKRIGFVCYILFISISIWKQRHLLPYAPQEYDKYKAALAANTLIPAMEPEKNIGAFNTGIYNYFLELDVINLDGVVNPDALAALQSGDMANYIQEKNIGYLIENDIGEATNLNILVDDQRVELEKLFDLTSLYKAYDGVYAQRTYIWRVEVRSE